jgi:hypothetical protein
MSPAVEFQHTTDYEHSSFSENSQRNKEKSEERIGQSPEVKQQFHFQNISFK